MVNTRTLWNNIMSYREFDRVPVMHWKGWPETRERWLAEGLPENVDEHRYFNSVPIKAQVDINVRLFPVFTEETFEETDEYRIFRQEDGVIAKHWKNRSCIPHFIDFTLKNGSNWPDYKKRLLPDPARISKYLYKEIADAEGSGLPVSVNTGSLVGWIRNWMGVENLAYLCFDDRDLFSEMVDTIANLVCWGLDQVLPKVKVDFGWGWEDICFRSGPLISPGIFKECVVPGYSKISTKLLEYGVDLHMVDCDGLIDDLIPLWLDGGVNVMFPVEIGVWKADPYKLRKKYGKTLRILGGIDKLEIAKGPGAIDAEIARRLPLMKEGGFVPLPDHLITPETSLDNYKYYLDRIRGLRF